MLIRVRALKTVASLSEYEILSESFLQFGPSCLCGCKKYAYNVFIKNSAHVVFGSRTPVAATENSSGIHLIVNAEMTRFVMISLALVAHVQY